MLLITTKISTKKRECILRKTRFNKSMDYLRMDEKQYASKVRNKALEDFDWLSQCVERKFLAETG